MNHNITLPVITAVLGLNLVAAPASAKQCQDIGGMALADAIDETHLVAALSGVLEGGASATITQQEKTPTGLMLDMQHHFINQAGGHLKTMDKAELTTVPGKSDTYMLEIHYNVVEASGTYAGYQGQFQSYGLIKLGAGKVVLRYQGEICR